MRNRNSCALAMAVSISAFFLALLAPAAVGAEVKDNVYKLVKNGKIFATITATGTQKSIRISIVNPNSVSYRVVFPYGTIFWSADEGYQNLALTVNNEIVVPASSAVSVTIETACMNAGRPVPPKGFMDWTVRYDSGLANLLTFFYSGQALFGTVIKPEHLSTKEKKKEFLQGIVWVYCDATKKQMRKFAGKYMFESRDEADAWVDIMYPLAKQFIDLYKVMHGSKTLK